MGVPEDWDRIYSWIRHDTVVISEPHTVNRDFKRKCEEIPILANYAVAPLDFFWKYFPSKPLPSVLETALDVNKFKELSKTCINWFYAQIKRASTVIHNLTHGAPTHQMLELPSLDDRNCPSAIEYGKEVTDCVATWVKSGFAAGPFVTPPLKKFRCNSLMAVPQDNKVRPVLNVSSPKDRSLNDNIDLVKLETVKMTSAKAFGYSICEAGKGAIMSKFDIVAAYKAVPACIEDYRLQGFRWLNRFFIELKQIFGAITSVSNFYQLGKTVVDIVLSTCHIPKRFVHRQLDDVPVVAPKYSGLCEQFSYTYKYVCNEIIYHLPLTALTMKRPLLM